MLTYTVGITADPRAKPDVLALNVLETLHIGLYSGNSPEEGQPGHVPYQQGLLNATSFLRRLNAERIRDLIIVFDTTVVTKSETEFLTYLRGMRNDFEDVILNGQFPSLRSIVMDVGAIGDAIPIWTAQVKECFPLIAARDLLRVMEHISSRSVRNVSCLYSDVEFK